MNNKQLKTLQPGNLLKVKRCWNLKKPAPGQILFVSKVFDRKSFRHLQALDKNGKIHKYTWSYYALDAFFDFFEIIQ